MAGNRLRVEDERILDQVARLEQAIAAYRELGENPLAEPLEHLNGMNSSFTERLHRLLDNLTDKNPVFLENIENISGTAAEIANNLREVDTEIVSSMGGA